MLSAGLDYDSEVIPRVPPTPSALPETHLLSGLDIQEPLFHTTLNPTPQLLPSILPHLPGLRVGQLQLEGALARMGVSKDLGSHTDSHGTPIEPLPISAPELSLL